MHFNLRPGHLADAEAGGLICYEAFKMISGQHNLPPDFPSSEVACGLFSSLLSRPDVYSVVAESGGRIVGSSFLWEDAAIAGIGPLTIAPDVQNSTLGRRLMEDILARARQKRFAGMRLVQAGDENACNRLCQNVHGHDRGQELRQAIQQGTATIVKHAGHIPVTPH